MDQTDNLETRARQARRMTAVNISRADVLVAVGLILTVLIGAYFRFMGNNWDDFVRFHPDERYLTMQIGPNLGGMLRGCSDTSEACIERMERIQECQTRYPESGGRGSYFDAQCSPYNPDNIELTQYRYGTAPLFIAHIAADLYADFTGNALWTTSAQFHLVWRAVSAVAESLVILLVFFIGLRVHNKWVGLTAAVLYAFTVFSIQQAHFGTADAITNLFVTLGIYFLVRVQDTDSLIDYALFGVAVGLAVASRINVAPLAFLLAVPMILRMLPAADSQIPWAERSRHLWNPLTGGVLAAGVAFITFRVANPYAFTGPGFFGILPYEPYFESLRAAQFDASGANDWAPNWQWVDRTPYWFAFRNIVVWGMGIALGLLGWFGFVWAGWRVLRGKTDAMRNIVLVAWVVGYFGFVGGIWVMSMRYYLPLYPVLTVLAAWVLVSMVRGAWQSPVRWRRFAAAAATVGVVGFTMLWGLMFTNIYRNMASFAQSGVYTWEQIPGDFYMQVEGADPDTPLMNVALRNSFVPPGVPQEIDLLYAATRVTPTSGQRATVRAFADGTVTTVTANRIAGVEIAAIADTTATPTQISYSDAPRTLTIEVLDPATGQIIGYAEEEAAFLMRDHLLGEPYVFAFDAPFEVEAGRDYTFVVNVEGGPVITSGAVMGTELLFDEAIPSKVCYPLPDGLTLADSPGSGLFTYEECLSQGTPAPWEGLVHVENLELYWPDNQVKQDYLETILNQTDYIWVNTNRRYDTHSRVPLRWPLTNAYYDALFSGDLGFEHVRTFQESFELGPLKISDQYLPYYDAPAWLNEFEPEEAFTVYDHPAVMLFRKTDAYSPENTALVLDSVPLTPTVQPDEYIGGSYNSTQILNRLPVTSLQADNAPTYLMFTEEMEQIQEDGGTWSERFDTSSAVNQNEILALVVWWLVIILFGIVIWPVLFVTFPGLGDRGYGFAKIVGLTVVAWLAWTLATLRFRVWNQAGIILILLALGAFSLWIAWRNREAILRYLRARWRLLLTIEFLSLVMFIAFVLVRMQNPDLWHNSYGGEKPMDFAYFNGVLRSTIFPAIDPWFANGYINYYYVGFVIVGTPTLLTGIVPAVAYNLILPTLFSVTGLGAFSLAFSLVNSWRRSRDTEAENGKRRQRTLGNPYLAGVVALLMAVVLGNLDTMRVFGNGVAQLGGYEQPQGLQWWYQNQLVDDFIMENGRPPDPAQNAEITQLAFQEAQSVTIFDRIAYEVDNTTSLIGGLVGGFGEMLQGATPSINASRWFWGPTRVIAEIPNSGDGAINEMPYFTFLYGDLHAHMIAMPLMIFALAFVFHEVLIAGRDRRKLWMRLLALALGGLVIGLFQGVNTWDYPTFMILAVLGLGYAWWLSWEQISRWSLMSMVFRVGGFLVLQWLAALPFTWFFASGITEFMLWEGNKTPLWAYIDIHGLFLFVIVSMLMWETARWAASVKVADLRGRLNRMYLILGGFLFTLGVALVLAIIEYQVALIVLPLIAWITLLFFRPGQSRAMQYVLVVTGLALAITLGTEFITLRFDNGRQNTIFKFYIQVWLIFSVVGGAAVAWVVQNSMAWRSRLAVPWYTVFGLLFLIAAMFPITATRAKNTFRLAPETPPTLDGLAYMQYANHFEGMRCIGGGYGCGASQEIGTTIDLTNDYNAIRWLQENVEGTPTIMEALSLRVLYRWGGRISVNTGLPSVVGWDYHQTQQRSIGPLKQLIESRRANVNAFYETTSIDEAVDILRFYDVRYVIHTDYEEARYRPGPQESGLGVESGLDKFPVMVAQGLMDIAYQEGGAIIYEVNQAALDRAFVARLNVLEPVMMGGAE